jgi:hypothetical protein
MSSVFNLPAKMCEENFKPHKNCQWNGNSEYEIRLIKNIPILKNSKAIFNPNPDPEPIPKFWSNPDPDRSQNVNPAELCFPFRLTRSRTPASMKRKKRKWSRGKKVIRGH